MSDFFTQLGSEAKKWQQDKIISAAQKKKILDRYGAKVADYEKVEASGKINSVISILGAILLGVGVLLLVGANWQEIPNIARVAILLVATFSAAWAGYHFHTDKQTYPKTGFALIILANLMIGATIFLIAQIYHVNAHASSLLMLWLLAVLPMAYSYRSGLLISLVAVLFGFWMPMFLSEQPISGVGVHWFALYFAYGALYLGLGTLSDRKGFEHFSAALKTWGVTITLGIFYLFTFEDLIREIQDTEAFTHLPLAVISVPAFIVALVCIAKGDKSSFKEGMIAFAVAAFAWIAQLTNPDPTLSALIMNLLLLGGSIGLIVQGYRIKQAFLVYLGLAFFTLHIFTRYIDWFFELLPRSLFFIVGGALFIAVGIFLEKQRKKIVATL